MKLLRYGPPGSELPATIGANNKLRDLSGVIDDLGGEALSPDSIERLKSIDVDKLPLLDWSNRIGPCVANVGTFVGIGLNYRDHAAESEMDIPEEPVMFLKSTSSIVGPYDDVVIPRGALKTDWEVELGVIIGSRASYVDKASALKYVAGYCVVNDISERAFQLEGSGQWARGKGCDTFGPIGPYLVTKDEIPDPQKLMLWLDVDGERQQQGTTANMIFTVAEIVAYVSQYITLRPGDIITTGTPAGVGLGQRPQRYLRAGNEMRLGIDELGEQKQRVRSS